MTPFDAQAAIDRALDYPYDVVEGTFLFESGVFQPFPETLGDVLARRRPVLALGSNGSRTKLRALFDEPAERHVIPIVRSVLHDFDVVYSAHLTRYGALPAALAPSAGTSVTISVLYLTDLELEKLHGTEALGRNYDFARLRGIRLEVPGIEPLSEAYVYVTRHGLLAEGGAPVALDAVRAEGRRYPSMTEREILTRSLAIFPEVRGLEGFIVENVRDAARRAARTARLRRDAIAPEIAGLEVLEG
ncbi:MAG: hypothetical protein KC466_00825 [Myxococcales bacterium]|nr:hypothetical protein [Myxococcales bacterium]